MRRHFLQPILLYLSRLRFPYLFAITVVLLAVDLVTPDVIPFVDEILLALIAMVLAAIRRRNR